MQLNELNTFSMKQNYYNKARRKLVQTSDTNKFLINFSNDESISYFTWNAFNSHGNSLHETQEKLLTHNICNNNSNGIFVRAVFVRIIFPFCQSLDSYFEFVTAKGEKLIQHVQLLSNESCFLHFHSANIFECSTLSLFRLN